jgi:hypothetical protein
MKKIKFFEYPKPKTPIEHQNVPSRESGSMSPEEHVLLFREILEEQGAADGLLYTEFPIIPFYCKKSDFCPSVGVVRCVWDINYSDSHVFPMFVKTKFLDDLYFGRSWKVLSSDNSFRPITGINLFYNSNWHDSGVCAKMLKAEVRTFFPGLLSDVTFHIVPFLRQHGMDKFWKSVWASGDFSSQKYLKMGAIDEGLELALLKENENSRLPWFLLPGMAGPSTKAFLFHQFLSSFLPPVGVRYAEFCSLFETHVSSQWLSAEPKNKAPREVRASPFVNELCRPEFLRVTDTMLAEMYKEI